MAGLGCAYVLLEDRGVLAIEGPDARAFLQALVSNDVTRVTTERAIYAALLTPQGKFLHDFFVAASGDALLLDCEAARRDDLKRRLGLYRLRSKVTLTDRSDALLVAAAYGKGVTGALDLADAPGTARPAEGGVIFVDPRLAEAGARAILPREAAPAVLEAASLAAGAREEYERLRIALGLPDGSRDMEVDKAILLENGFDELHGVDWRKGCYIGQELTARTRYRGLIKKRLIPVRVEGPLPAPGTPVRLAEREVGQIRSGAEGMALALLRLDALERAGSEFGGEAGSTEGALTAGEASLVPQKPAWATF
jgi:folate-binding protein YgfZ